ncbi:helix-turn-helix transcriptional regulator [Curtobacterium flaccumfaciens]|uniref:helix-turn-helix transcriptional regulator n=1 Tax=Curtobacterium flaccumfaciens TaxID=2035 RepID=UPI000FFEAAA6|nr:helix-turn-helix transcriptional regulator [Curtobacterium flaccumfaciens]MCS0644347.1 helix-turn-helix transcriptional regulator [Curtobacterium flaccumfaciens pv. flaccumfaciens]MCS6527073.1 helix-turn-helix transcriptional regulator [Curtobacterium flaccumfaciens pv. flaccumfaciens]MCS6528787.1 helix-turn-helix transcriptional regulator [Curtobacterium flaccumfaciens pv. flaccumfaciens]NUU09017.1 transcriptional regulator [Curtobacterium flaccumfaciens]RXF83549.1 transcriptional regulato
MRSFDPAAPLVRADEDEGHELGRFLAAKRARIRPDDVGLPAGGRRRVPGLRREEVAMLAGVSPAYYTRLEQGDAGRVSNEVVSALSRALRLAPVEAEHLFRLVDPRGEVRRNTCSNAVVRPELQSLLDALSEVPAMIVGRRSDILAWNALASLLFGDLERLPRSERNWARLVFLHPAHRDLFIDWHQKAADVVGQLRIDAGFHPTDLHLAALVGELAMKSTTFARLWARHEVQDHCHRVQHLDHPAVGQLELQVESFRVAGEEDKSLVTYRAAPGSPTDAALRQLRAGTANSSH